MTGPRILVVEDEAITAMSIAADLASFGYQATVAHSAEEALRKAGECRPDLLLTDIQLGGGPDGVAVAEQIRKLCDTPCIYLTGFGDQSTFARAESAEPLAYILKPFQKNELRNAIEIALRRQRKEDEQKTTANLLTSVLENRPDGLIVADESGRIRYVNRRAEQMIHLPRRQVLGKPLEDVLCECAPLKGAPGLAELCGRPPSAQGAFQRRSSHPIEASVVRIRSEQSQPAGCYVLLRESVAVADHSPAHGAERTAASSSAVTRTAAPMSSYFLGGEEREEGLLADAIRQGKRLFAVCFVVERYDFFRSRFGTRVAQQLVDFYSVHIAQQLLETDRLLNWGGPCLLALLERPEESLEPVRKQVLRYASAKLEHFIELGARTSMLTISARWRIFSLSENHSLEEIFDQINAFAA